MSLRAVDLAGWGEHEDEQEILDVARADLIGQAEALRGLAGRLDGAFTTALRLLLRCTGRVVVCGMGKSGLVGRKIAATLSSTGTPAFFLHPGDAIHGDLGSITRHDILLLISHSGQTLEMVNLLPHFRDLGLPIIAMVGNLDAPVAREAHAVLDISVERETCPHNLAPTTSTLTTLALGDALAMAALRARRFTPKDFARFHPGGTLGRRLTRRVRDVMKYLDLPLTSDDIPVEEALLVMSTGRCGLVIVVDDERRPIGIVTDGDLRRALQRPQGLLGARLSEIMTRKPVTISEDAMYKEAQERMHRLRIKALIAVDEAHRVTGVVEIFDDA